MISGEIPQSPPVLINNQAVERVQQQKYLGMVTDDRLAFEPQVDALCKKAHERTHFYWKLCAFNVDNTFMRMFDLCFIELILAFSFICWFGSVSLKLRGNLQSAVKVCSKTTGVTLNDMNTLYQSRVLNKFYVS